MKKWIVIIAYDEEALPAIKNKYPDIDEDFLYCGCFEAQQNDKYSTFIYQTLEINIDNRHVRDIRKPGFNYNDAVESIPPQSKVRGNIYKILWNFEYQEFRYFITADNSKSLSYYTERNLIALSSLN